jgi:hypothetical protein
MRSIYAAAYSPSIKTEYDSSQNAGGTDRLEISEVGNLMNVISQMNSSDQSSIQSFMKDLTASVKAGTFDASTAASKAPDSLVSYAEENGIDLTQLVQDLADGSVNNSGVYGPPPPMMPDMSKLPELSGTFSLDLSSLDGLSSSDKSELESFLTDLTASVKDGTFDASTTASEAPDTLVSLAEENGIDLTTLLQDLADGIESEYNAEKTFNNAAA